MRIVHLSEPGGELRVDGQRLLAVRGGDVVAAVRLPQVRTLVLHGAYHLSGPVLARLLAAGVEVVFLSSDGRYRGRLETVPSSAALLRVSQARVAADAARRLALAWAVVRNKLESQRRVLRALRREPLAAWWQAVCLLALATTVTELSGAEGWATRAYFGVLRAVLPQLTEQPRWRRHRRPRPLHPVRGLSSGGKKLPSRTAGRSTATVPASVSQAYPRPTLESRGPPRPRQLPVVDTESGQDGPRNAGDDRAGRQWERTGTAWCVATLLQCRQSCPQSCPRRRP